MKKLGFFKFFHLFYSSFTHLSQVSPGTLQNGDWDHITPLYIDGNVLVFIFGGNIFL